MQTAFLFVDSGGPDREAKRQMRRHVMKGKNVGKKLHRPSRLDLATGNQAQSKRASIPSSIREGRQSTQAVHASGISSRRLTFPKRPSSVGVDRRFGDDFQAFGVPVGLSRDSKQVVDECKASPCIENPFAGSKLTDRPS
jgi:hypothetical protein